MFQFTSMGVVLMVKWQLICHQKSEFGLLTLYQLSFWNHNSYHAAKRKQLTQIYLPYNQFLLPYKRSIFTIKVAKMIWFLEKSTLYPDLPYKWSVLYHYYENPFPSSYLLLFKHSFQERTDQVRAEYEKILQQKLGEQYDAFVRLVLFS